MDPAGGCPDKAAALPRSVGAMGSQERRTGLFSCKNTPIAPGENRRARIAPLPESLPKGSPIFAMNVVGRTDGIAVGPLDDKEETRPIPLPACHSFDLNETFLSCLCGSEPRTPPR